MPRQQDPAAWTEKSYWVHFETVNDTAQMLKRTLPGSSVKSSICVDFVHVQILEIWQMELCVSDDVGCTAVACLARIGPVSLESRHCKVEMVNEIIFYLS